MSGSWEIKQSNNTLVSILHTDVTTVAWALGLRNLIIPGGIQPLAGMPYDMARNVACKTVLDQGLEWLFFLDSDVVPPRDAILRLQARRQPIISGLYNRRSPPHSVPVMIRNGGWVTEFVPGSVVEVDLVGAGCLLIHRTVLEAFNKNPQRPGSPWFDWRVNLRGLLPEGECLSEDFTFCQAARRMGYKVLVDTGICCKHIGLAEATFGQFQPVEATPVT